MAEPGAGRAAGPMIAVLAVAHTLLPANAAEASCSKGSRIDRMDAESPSARWNIARSASLVAAASVSPDWMAGFRLCCQRFRAVRTDITTARD